MHKLDVKRKEIEALIAMELGLGSLDGLSARDRSIVDQQTEESIQGCFVDADEPADCEEANPKLRQLLADYRTLSRGKPGREKRDV